MQTILANLSVILKHICIYTLKYTPTGSYVAVEVAELAIFAVGTLWMMWVIRSYKLKKPLDDEQERTVFKFIVILTNTFWMTF